MSSDTPIAEPPPVRAEPRIAAGSTTEYFIQGVTAAGVRFRPGDWAERLCGVLSPYRPAGSADRGASAHMGYSPYARPVTVGGIKCVVVDDRLRELVPMAFDFVMNFARDNDLLVVEACALPEATPSGSIGRR